MDALAPVPARDRTTSRETHCINSCRSLSSSTHQHLLTRISLMTDRSFRSKGCRTKRVQKRPTKDAESKFAPSSRQDGYSGLETCGLSSFIIEKPCDHATGASTQQRQPRRVMSSPCTSVQERGRQAGKQACICLCVRAQCGILK